MGMYDEVVFDVKCDCGAKVDGFQTKHGDNTLTTYTIKELYKLNPGASWHSNCDACDRWHEYTFDHPPKIVRTEEYNSWNYVAVEESGVFGVKESHGKYGLTADFITPTGDTLEELIEDLENMLNDVKHYKPKVKKSL